MYMFRVSQPIGKSFCILFFIRQALIQRSMKKALIFLFLFLWGCFLLAQRPKSYDPTYLTIPNQKERTAYFDNMDQDRNLLVGESGFRWNPINRKWYLTDSIIYRYNSRGAISEVISFEWKGQKWKENKRFLHLYNPQGKLILYATQVWKKGIWGQEEDDEQELYKYDSNGNETERLLQKWNGKKWKTYKRTLRTYYEDTDLPKSILYQDDIKGNGKYVNSAKREYHKYDEQDNLLSWAYQRWDVFEKRWDDSTQFDKTLTETGLTKTINQKKISLDGVISEQEESLYAYDEEDRLIKLTSNKWNIKEEEWEVDVFSRNLYDDENKVKIFEQFKVNKATGLVEIQFRNIYHINEFNRIDDETRMIKGLDGAIEKSTYYEYQFRQFEDSVKPEGILRKRWDAQTGKWVNDLLSRYTYRRF
jgi:hypothetical protein